MRQYNFVFVLRRSIRSKAKHSENEKTQKQNLLQQNECHMCTSMGFEQRNAVD